MPNHNANPEDLMARCASAALLAAVEIYNKPTVEAREATFAMLITHAWEVLIKARIVQQSGSTLESIYRTESGNPKSYVLDSDTSEPLTISLDQAIARVSIPGEVTANIRGLAKIRNTAVHLGVLEPEVRNTILGYGTASVLNFIKLSGRWFVESPEIPYLLPVGFIGSSSISRGTVPRSQKDLLKILNGLSRANSSQQRERSDYDVSINVEVNLSRGISSGGQIGITNDPNAPLTRISDTESFEYYSHSYNELVDACRERYKCFKANAQIQQTNEIYKGRCQLRPRSVA